MISVIANEHIDQQDITVGDFKYVDKRNTTLDCLKVNMGPASKMY